MKSILAIPAMCWLCLSPLAHAEEKPELRAVWITRMEWANPDPAECKARITRAMDTLGAANCNVAIFQIRGAADTLYPSKLEPWSPMIGGKDPGFDPLEFAIQEARRNNLSVHAYINAMPMLEPRWVNRPPDPAHLWHRHGPDSPEPWVDVDREGKASRLEYYWMSPGIPAVQEYVRNVIMDVVRRYDIGGVHLDRIRYPGPEYSHDPVSRQRFLGRGNPNMLDHADWQREQLNKFINDLSAEMRAEKPQVIFSCSAWGIYNRYHIAGYNGFSSGYHDYFQDTWQWYRLGAMDVLMPMIYWNMSDPKPNYHELIADFVQGVGGDHLVGGQRMFSPEENIKQIQVTREAGGLGTVLFSLGSASRRGILEAARKEIYQQKVPVPVLPRLAKPDSGVVLGTVQAEDGKPLVDAWLSLKPMGSPATAPVFKLTWTSSADGRFAFHNVPPGQVQVVARYEGVPSVTSEVVEVKAGEVARLTIKVSGAGDLRDKPYLTVMRPRGDSTTEEVLHLLGRTAPAAKVTVNKEGVEVFATGAFAKDNIALQMGENQIEITAAEGDRSITKVLKITRTAPPEQKPAAASLRIVEPAPDVAVQAGQMFVIKAQGPAGRSGLAMLGELKLPLAEGVDKDGKANGTYTATIRLPASAVGAKMNVKARLEPSGDAAALETESKGSVEVWDPAVVRVAETNDETGILTGLHEVRLGGPWLGWVSKGTRFEVIGRSGRMYQVKLSPSTVGWVFERAIRLLPVGTALPHNYFTSCDISGKEGEDSIGFAMHEPVAVIVRPEIEPSNRLIVDVFNTHNAVTWMSHKATSKILGPVRAEQIEPDHVRLTVPVKGKQIWGYWTEMKDGFFVLHVRRPPNLAAAPDSPLKGLTIAVEAGHGGSGSGAMGVVGTKEKTINYEASLALERELKARGAKVVQLRRGDEEPSLSDRAAKAVEAGADFFVSMHANSAGSSRGILRVSGTSTYYHTINCQLAAELVYKKLLELGWGEFGVVGDFSYAPLRNTRVPGLLVEQAFMSHPGDEARMLDPTYQHNQAVAIVTGLEEFLNRVRE